MLAAVIGVPVSALAYGFLKLVAVLQTWFFGTLPKELGFHGVPAWWPLPLLAVAGLLVSSVIRYLPGRGGHSRPTASTPAGRPIPSICPVSCWPPWPPSAWAWSSALRPR